MVTKTEQILFHPAFKRRDRVPVLLPTVAHGVLSAFSAATRAGAGRGLERIQVCARHTLQQRNRARHHHDLANRIRNRLPALDVVEVHLVVVQLEHETARQQSAGAQ